jgi:cytoplasmic iron level regulating protein YaaA (DUF328/UPF0246 family)
VLIVAPPSESKRPAPEAGPPVDLAALSFPELTPLRVEILEALEVTSAAPDAFRRLQVRPGMAAEVARNTAVRELPTRPVLDVYSGPLHEGLDAATLSPDARAGADDRLVVASSLWGALRPVDRIPPYRLHICSHLYGLDRLEPLWRSVLPGVLAEAAGDRGLVVDLRSPGYQAIGMPQGLGERTVTLRIEQRSAGGRIGDVIAKRMRGQAARLLLEQDADPDDPAELAAILGEGWPVVLESPRRAGGTHRLTLLVTD